MSNTRGTIASPTDTTAQQTQQPTDSKGGFLKAVFTGLLVGPISSTLTYPIDKVAFTYQTYEKAGTPSSSTVFKAAFKNPLHGYFPGVFNSACKTVVMYPTKCIFEEKLNELNPNGSCNKELAAFGAGTATVYTLSPVSVLKALRYKGIPVSDIKNQDLTSFYRGVHATALRDGVQLGMFFGMMPYVSSYIPNPFWAGVAANLIGSVASNPISVISTNQKIDKNGGSMYKTSLTLFKQDGVRSFYRGFGRTTALRMAIQGGTTGVIIDFADRNYESLFNSRKKVKAEIDEPKPPTIKHKL